MRIIQLREQLAEGSPLGPDASRTILPYLAEGQELAFTVRRGCDLQALCLSLRRVGSEVRAGGSYFVGLDWIARGELAVQVLPKMNDGFEVDYLRMLHEALSDTENFDHLQDLITIRLDQPLILIDQQHDWLSLFLITVFIHLLQKIVRKGLKRSFYLVEENLHNKVKGRISVGRTVRQQLMKGHVTDNVCQYQVYDVDTPENRVLKKALRFCMKQLESYKKAFDTRVVLDRARYCLPYFERVSDDVSIKAIQSCKCNPVYKDYTQAVDYAQLLLKRFGYNISSLGSAQVATPPFWIDMSKLFELYVFQRLREVFTGRNEVRYHLKANYQELDYLLQPRSWAEPYVIDAKYKPRYRGGSISKEDAREVAGYARLSKIYQLLGLNEETALPIKCLIIYPDQHQDEHFGFSAVCEPAFERFPEYVRIYKLGIKLPVIRPGGIR